MLGDCAQPGSVWRGSGRSSWGGGEGRCWPAPGNWISLSEQVPDPKAERSKEKGGAGWQGLKQVSRRAVQCRKALWDEGCVLTGNTWVRAAGQALDQASAYHRGEVRGERLFQPEKRE